MGLGSHPLEEVMNRAALGRFPDPGPVSVIPPPPHLRAAVVAFSGHTFVAADVDPNDVETRLGDDPLAGPVLPPFLEWLAASVGGRAGNHDAVLVCNGTGGGSEQVELDPTWPRHRRAQHGARLRREITGWRLCNGLGIVLIGRGLAGRWEIAFEAADHAPPGTGRILAALGPTLVPADQPVFAQVSPGHARSLRACLAAGYRPIGSEVLFA